MNVLHECPYFPMATVLQLTIKGKAPERVPQHFSRDCTQDHDAQKIAAAFLVPSKVRLDRSWTGHLFSFEPDKKPAAGDLATGLVGISATLFEVGCKRPPNLPTVKSG
jgi:hypothetical protein